MKNKLHFNLGGNESMTAMEGGRKAVEGTLVLAQISALHYVAGELAVPVLQVLE